VNRRQVLLRGALLAAMAPVVRMAVAGEEAARSGAFDAGAAPLLAVHDPAYRRSREFAAALEERGARAFPLAPDAMTAWHRTLRAALAGTPSARIVGLTTRSDYLVLRDLARAVRFVPLATRDADAHIARAGVARHRATLIAWVLGARAGVA